MTTLSRIVLELAFNPNIQEKLYEEVKDCIDSKGDIDYDLLAKLPYLDAIISETLRLHSSPLRLRRICTKDYKLGDTGITVHKGQAVRISIYAIHRSEEYFPNPDQFIPERLLLENRDKIIPYTYLPFGGGPRNCIGIRLAQVEVKLCLAYFIYNFKVYKPTDIPELIIKSYIFNLPKQVIVGIEKRTR